MQVHGYCLAGPVLSQEPGEQAQEVVVLSEARQEATGWTPRPHTPAGLGAAFSAPLPPGPSWGIWWQQLWG